MDDREIPQIIDFFTIHDVLTVETKHHHVLVLTSK